MKNSTIGFSPLEHSGKDPLKKGTIPDQLLDTLRGDSLLKKFGTIIYIVVCLLIFAFVIYPTLQTNYDDDNEENSVNYN